MKQKIITAIMIIAALLLPMGSSAKGPAVNVVLKDFNGVRVGTVTGMETIGWPYVLTDEGFRTFFRMKGVVSLFPDTGIGFTLIECKGDTYVGRGMYVGAVFLPIPNLNEFYDDDETSLLYVPNNAQRETVTIKSERLDDGSCGVVKEGDVVGKVFTVYRAYLNDPYITGIENTEYSGRMYIE